VASSTEPSKTPRPAQETLSQGSSPEPASFDPPVGRDRDVKLEGAMGGGGDGPDPSAAKQLDRDLGVQGASPEGADTEIAADDAGATAMAERAQKRSEGMENDG
jgi:hypothetical protein